MKTRVSLLLLAFLSLAFPAGSQTAYLSRSVIPFYISLSPFAHNPKDSIPNMVTPDYQFHPGRCDTRSGKTLRGWFSFAPVSKKFDFFTGTKLKQKKIILFKPEENAPQVTLRFDEVERLTLAGKDSAVATPGDSTLFIYSVSEGELMRQIMDKPVPVYDDVLLTDELSGHKLIFWRTSSHQYYNTNPVTGSSTFSSDKSYILANPVWEWVDARVYRQLRICHDAWYEWNGKLNKVKSWKDLSGKFAIDPYILKVADKFNKVQVQDLVFGMMLSYAGNRMQLLPFFEETEIRMADKRVLKGRGFIQPFNGDGFGKTGYMHFAAGNKFMLLEPGGNDTIVKGNRTYVPVFDNFNNRWYIAFEYPYEGTTWYVAEGLDCEGPNGFFDEDGDPVIKIFSRKKNGKYVLEENRKLYRAISAGLDLHSGAGVD